MYPETSPQFREPIRKLLPKRVLAAARAEYRLRGSETLRLLTRAIQRGNTQRIHELSTALKLLDGQEARFFAAQSQLAQRAA